MSDLGRCLETSYLGKVGSGPQVSNNVLEAMEVTTQLNPQWNLGQLWDFLKERGLWISDHRDIWIRLRRKKNWTSDLRQGLFFILDLSLT